MRFSIVTLFPELFASFLQSSLLGKAREAGLIQVGFVDPRSFAEDRHRTVDDTPYGGGDGMVMKVEPLIAAMESISSDGAVTPHRVLLTPQGAPLVQSTLHALRERQHVVLVCGRYEGVDERVRSFVHEELSLGDFVLNGGEVAAMAVIDGVSRLVPGVLGNPDSLKRESHAEPLLEYPQYTRPREFRGQAVPDVLLQGDHERIARWRRLQMLVRTRQRRPDLWARHALSEEDVRALGGSPKDHLTLAQLAGKTYIALLHYPVYDRSGRVVTTAITNLDLHDIARSAKTYGLAGYFVVTPLSSQKELASRILAHWQEGHGASSHEDRRQALQLLHVAESLEEVVAAVEKREGRRPVTIATTAAAREKQLGAKDVLKWLRGGDPVVILMGTGWGLAREVLEQADLAVRPLQGGSDYNHLSVRSAAAILLDRFFGVRDDA